MGITLLGRIRTCCDGSLYAGPDGGMLFVSCAVCVVPSAVAAALVAPNAAALVVMVLLMLLTVACLFATAFSDPGIIPRQPAPPPSTTPAGDEPGSLDEYVDVEVEHPDRIVTHKVLRRWCYTCNVLRPPRASHCPYCDCCIERHDHHCPWTGTCIGGRNYRYFYSFLASAVLLAVYSICMCVAELAIETKAAGEENDTLSTGERFAEGAAKSYYMAVVIGIYSAMLLCCVGSLCAYHTQLVAADETTHERLRGKFTDSPYDHGCRQNTATVLCGPRRESRVPPFLRGEPDPDTVEERARIFAARAVHERRAAEERAAADSAAGRPTPGGGIPGPPPPPPPAAALPTTVAASGAAPPANFSPHQGVDVAASDEDDDLAGVAIEMRPLSANGSSISAPAAAAAGSTAATPTTRSPTGPGQGGSAMPQ